MFIGTNPNKINIFTKAAIAGKPIDEYPCTLYLVELSNDNEKFIKIGITTNRIYQRFHENPYKLKIHYQFNSNIEECLKQEQKILKDYSKYKYNPEISFKGYTECLEFNILDQIKNVLTARNGQ